MKIGQSRKRFLPDISGRLAGYEDVNDAERLRHDPAMRWIVWRQGGSGLCGFTEPDGPLRDAMARGTREPLCYYRFVRPVDRPCARPKATPWLVLDMDSSVSPTYGEQEMSVWNGHLRLHLLSSAVGVQPVWRPRTLCSAWRQRAQR